MEGIYRMLNITVKESKIILLIGTCLTSTILLIYLFRRLIFGFFELPYYISLIFIAGLFSFMFGLIALKSASKKKYHIIKLKNKYEVKSEDIFAIVCFTIVVMVGCLTADIISFIYDQGYFIYTITASIIILINVRFVYYPRIKKANKDNL